MDLLSIIIPVLNEEELLPGMLDAVEKCRANVPFGIECIVVDGGSVDNSARICRASKATCLASAPGRGQQLSVGARDASGQVLMFLHVDCKLTPEHCLAAERFGQRKGILAAGFTLQFADRHPILKFAEVVNKVRFRVTKVIYGDHGLLIRKAEYVRLGGFPQQSLFEDVDFSRKLRKNGKVELIDLPLQTSSRRFRRKGIVRTYLAMAGLHILHQVGVSPRLLAKLYN